MSKTIKATYDGEVFHPEEDLDLEPNTRVRITIEESKERAKNARSFLDVAASLNLEGPSDWSGNFENYLYEGQVPASDKNNVENMKPRDSHDSPPTNDIFQRLAEKYERLFSDEYKTSVMRFLKSTEAFIDETIETQEREAKRA